jgi:adenylate cyclase
MKRIGLLVVFILALPLVFQVTPLEILKLRVFDALVEKHEPSGNFVILNITEEDVAREGGWPIPRQRLAQIHVDLLNKGAIGVGWVVSFPQPDRFGGDEMFAEALSYGATVLATFEYDNQIYPKTSGTILLGENISGIMAKGVVSNDKVFSTSPQGISAAPVEIDNLVRRMPLLYQTPDGFTASYGTEVLKVLANAKSYIIKGDENGMQQITVQGLPPVDVDSLGRKWISWVKTPQTDLTEMDVAGKFVFVGTDAAGIMPQVATPAGLLEPHKIQAALAESILIPNSPKIPDWSIAAEISIFLVSVALIWLLTQSFGMSFGLVLGGSALIVTALSGAWLIRSGLLIDVSWSVISQFIAGSVSFYLRFREQFRLRLQIKKQFEHYLDPKQVKRLQDNPDLLKLGGEKRECTFLFTDLRGFTSLSEKLEPEQVTDIMNKVLTEQVKLVQAHGGMVDKFIGDACMAIFNAPLDIDEHENRAVACAQDMQSAIRMLNKELPEKVAIGVGVNTGLAVVGNMGSDTRFDFSAIGDAVNTAARLESATKEAGVDILIGENTAKNCKFVLKSLKSISVKGKKEPINVFTI